MNERMRNIRVPEDYLRIDSHGRMLVKRPLREGMYTSRWAQFWIMAGLLWFLLGIAWMPTNKLYQQGLVALLWLPVLASLWAGRERLRAVWQGRRLACAAFVSLLIWAACSLWWAEVEDWGRTFKRLLYVGLFMLSFVLLSNSERNLPPLLRVAGLGLALAALTSILDFYMLERHQWTARLQGMGELDHPILGGYVMGAAAVWLMCNLPKALCYRLACLLGGGCLFAFVALTQSRGACLALLVAVLLVPLLRPSRLAWGMAFAVLVLVALGFWMFEPLITARGASYRPEIFINSLRLIEANPWGVGLGTDYHVPVLGTDASFDHTHNLPLHIAVELGLPALALWAVLWLGALRAAWLSRRTELGNTALVMLIFASVAMQLDAASLWGTPRAEWFITWLPLALAIALPTQAGGGKRCAKLAGQLSDR